MSGVLLRWCYALVGLLLMALPCVAQLTVGDNLEMKINGQVSTGYSGSYGSYGGLRGGSTHALTFGGNGTVSGFYYDPKFVTFNVLPFYNQSRDNSSYQSLSDSSGITGTVNFINGSRFPGSVSYSKSYNSNGVFGLPGSANLTTHGDSQGFAIGWSALLPKLPTLTATFTTGGGGSTVYGTNAQSTSHTRSFALRSTYSILGFPLSATYNHSVSDTETPDIFSTQQVARSNTSSDVYSLALAHAIPLKGSFGTNITRSNFRSDYLAGRGQTEQLDFQSATATLHPWKKMRFLFTENYSSNLAGQINQAIVAIGGVSQPSSGPASYNLNVSGGVGYSIIKNLGVTAQATHVDQAYAGKNYSATYFSGTVGGGYGLNLFGIANWSVSVVDNATEAGNSSVGIIENVDVARKIKGWDLSSSFDYGENVQTLLVLYSSSYYRPSAQVSRRFSHRIRWSGQYGYTHSVVNGTGNGASDSQNYSSSLSVRWLGLTGNYSSSNGTSIMTTSGLQASPVPTPVLAASQVIAYGGSSYGVTVTGSPIRNLSVAVSYVKAFNNTTSNAVSSLNHTELMSGSLEYRLRKLGLRTGYTWFTQGISAASNTPIGTTTYYLGVFRTLTFY